MPAAYRFIIPALILIGNVAATETAKQPRFSVADMPLVFSPAPGDKLNTRFVSQSFGFSLLFSPEGATFLLEQDPARTGRLQLKLANARQDATISGLDQLPGKVNYLIGRDPAKWQRSIACYRKVGYRGVLPGIDLIYYGRNRRLEYDFRLAPDADPLQIQMVLAGDDWTAETTKAGDLTISSADGSVQFAKPIAYQVAADGSHQSVEASYSIRDAKNFGFKLGHYDRNRELVIDPSLVYSTYYGGSRYETANKIAIDSHGNTYIVGNTTSNDLPGTANGFQPIRQSSVGGYGTYANNTAFVAKFNPTGSELIYATYLGGSSSENGNGIAVDSSGNAIVVGWTNSTDFPLQNAVQKTCGPTATIDRFYCTYTPYSNCASLGGGNGSVPDAFIAKLDPTGSQLIYSTFFGGSQYDQANDVTVDAAGNAFVTGNTNSIPDTHAGCPSNGPYCGGDPPDQFAVPTTTNAYMQPPVTGGCPANSYHVAQSYTWFAKFSPAGALEYSSYFGPPVADEPGSGQTSGNKIALDATNKIYIVGSTQDTAFANIPGVSVQCGTANCNNGNWNAWAGKFDITASGAAQLVHSTMFGGSQNDYGNSLAVDGQGNAYTTGNTNSTDFPVTPGALATQYGGNGAGFVTKLNAQGTGMAYSTYLTAQGASALTANGIAADASGAAAVVGQIGGGGFTFPLVDPIEGSQGGNPNTGYLVRLTPDGSGILFSTYLGYFDTSVNAVLVDGAANAYVAGDSSAFLVTSGAYSTAMDGDHDAVIAKINMCTSALADISSQIQVTRGGIRYVNASKQFVQTVSLTNTSGASINGPIFLELAGLSSNAAASNATGTSTCVAPGSPYFKVLASGSMASGQVINLSLQFNDPSMGGITYSTAVRAGAGVP